MLKKKPTAEKEANYSYSLSDAQESALARILSRRRALAAKRVRQLTPYEVKLAEILKEKEAADKAERKLSGYSSFRYHDDNESSDTKTKTGITILAGTLAIGAAMFGPGLYADAQYGSDKAEQYLEQSGYSNLEHIATSTAFVGWQGCDGSDSVKYSFEATALNGDSVQVMVCTGILKAATIRAD